MCPQHIVFQLKGLIMLNIFCKPIEMYKYGKNMVNMLNWFILVMLINLVDILWQ